MKKQTMPTAFSHFTWALAIFCLPILLWPLALLISPNLLKNPSLTDLQVVLMSIFFWGYPVILGIIARGLYLYNKNNPRNAKMLLIISAVFFYILVAYISITGFYCLD